MLRFLGNENLPGEYPFTAGVYPYRREEEDPIRMFAGEGMPERTNKRFHYLAGRSCGRAPVDGVRFDDALRRGPDPRPGHLRPRSATPGVSIATLDDMKRLYSGFDLCAPSTSVSMTINGPAPMILGDVHEHGDRPARRAAPARDRQWDAAQQKIAELLSQAASDPSYSQQPAGRQ